MANATVAPSSQPGYVYDAEFLSYSQRISTRSAQRITKLVADLLNVHSVLDVGCAQGTWLNWWNQRGVEDFLGVDGDYVDRERLEIPTSHFQPHDVSQPIHLGRTFDLVQCLEVAEHIPAENAETLTDNLTRHGQIVLFSAAPPGQGGEYHVNEQPYDYWRERFSRRGYVAFDAIRPRLVGDAEVAVWYRYNTILYVHQDRLNDLPEQVRSTRLVDGESIQDISPIAYRARKLMVRCLPAHTQLALAKWVARWRG